METMQQATETFSKFRALQREAGTISTDIDLHRVFLIHGDEGQMTEVGYAHDSHLALCKVADRVQRGQLNEIVRHARGIVVEHGVRLHTARPDIEHPLDPDKIETAEQLEANYITIEAILTIGANSSGSWLRTTLMPGQNLPKGVEPPGTETEQITGDHPLARGVSIIETLALAIDVARRILEEGRDLPDIDLD